MGRLESLGGHTLNSPFQGNRDPACSVIEVSAMAINSNLVPPGGHSQLCPFLYPCFDFVLFLPLGETLELEGGFKII